MKREILEKQIRNLRNRRLGRAKKAKAIVTKNPEGAVKLSSYTQKLIPQPLKFPRNIVINQKPVNVNKSQGCGCSRRKG